MFFARIQFVGTKSSILLRQIVSSRGVFVFYYTFLFLDNISLTDFSLPSLGLPVKFMQLTTLLLLFTILAIANLITGTYDCSLWLLFGFMGSFTSFNRPICLLTLQLQILSHFITSNILDNAFRALILKFLCKKTLCIGNTLST